MNINGKNDSSYRYKMEPLKSSICGKGNGMFTIINNLDVVSKHLNHPSILILKYMGVNFGSIVNDMKQTITGSHTTEELQKCLQQYIDKFVICPSCGIPETIPKITKLNKKNILLELQCSSCSSSNNILQCKHSELIVKYLEKNEWNVNKGYMVKNISCVNVPNENISCENIVDELNPFI